MDKLNKKRLLAATLIELTARTVSKVQMPGTTRGNGILNEKVFNNAAISVKQELSTRGALDV